METLNIFSTQVFGKQCNFDLDIMKKTCLDFAQNTDSVTVSNIGGYQGPHFTNSELEEEIIQSLPKAEDKILKDIRLSMWLNINQEEDFNDLHSHAPFIGNAFSGVFYIQVPQKSGRIRFFDPRGVITSAIDQDYYNNSHRYFYVDPYENLLLIFPSWLEHSVEPSKSKLDRISVAFNIRIEYDKL